MIEALDWLRSVSSTAQLRGGQAPVCWRKDLSRQMTSTAAIRRACDWVCEIAAISPKMRDQTLFGDCLTELTRSSEEPPQPEPEAALPDRKRMMRTEETARTDLQNSQKASRPSLPPRSEPDCDSPAKEPGRRFFRPDKICPTQAVIRLRPEADRPLLCRLAGKEVVVDTSHRSGERERKLCGETPRVSPDRTVSRQDWLCRLAERAGSQCRRQGWEHRPQAGGFEPLDFPPEGGAPSPAGCAPNILSMAKVLADQWTLPLNGPSISSQSLSAVANERVSRHTGTDNRPARRSATEHHPSSSLTAIDGAELSKESRQQDRGGARDWALAAPSLDERAGLRAVELSIEHADERIRCGETDQSLSTPIAPPSLAPALPALLPSQQTSRVVATAVSINGARREETETQPDDLSDLAEKIQRILNEEARRHGISV